MSVEDQLRKLNLPPNFCLIPFTTLILEPDGKVGSCRHKGCDFPVGNLNDNTISEIWNSDLIQTWRREFLTGNVKICEKEIKYRKCHLCPENNKLLDSVDFSVVQKNPILRLGANFNGQCNLNCIMCIVNKKPNNRYQSAQFWYQLKNDIVPYLEEIDMLSGEPFIQHDTYRLIEMVSAENPKCKWIFTTNGHWFLDQEKINYFDKIIIKNMIISIDGITETTYAKIRRGGTLEIVKNNIQNLLKYNESRKISGKNTIDFRLNFLTQQDNWKEVDSFIDYANSVGIKPFVTYLYEPTNLSLSSLPQEKRIAIIEYYIKNLSWSYLKLMMRILGPLLDTIETKKESYLKQIFAKKLNFSLGRK